MPGATMAAVMVWATLAAALAVPLVHAGMSPLLEWREPAYVIAGFAGVVALALIVVQPMLALGALPGLPARRGRRVHAWIGGLLVAAVVVHVAGLWITSPPDVIDVLLFRSPTPFSDWGAIAMWALFAAALLAAFRRRISSRLGPRIWRLGHTGLVAVVVITTVVHALLIEGTMETVSKAALSALAVVALLAAILGLRSWTLLRRRKA